MLMLSGLQGGCFAGRSWIQLGGSASGCQSTVLLRSGTSQLMCTFWGPGWRGSSYEGHAFFMVATGVQVPHQTREAHLKVSLHVMSITFLWSDQVTWPGTELIGRGNIFLPKGKRRRCEWTAIHYHRYLLSEIEKIQKHLKVSTEI